MANESAVWQALLWQQKPAYESVDGRVDSRTWTWVQVFRDGEHMGDRQVFHLCSLEWSVLASIAIEDVKAAQAAQNGQIVPQPQYLIERGNIVENPAWKAPELTRDGKRVEAGT